MRFLGRHANYRRLLFLSLLERGVSTGPLRERSAGVQGQRLRRLLVTVLIALALVHVAVNLASAAFVPYTFVTGDEPSPQDASIAGLFSSGESVSGTWRYNAATAAATPLTGFTRYPNLINLSGSVAGLPFSDLTGFTLVANDVIVDPSFPGPVDFLELNAETGLGGPGHNLTGFVRDGFTLVNVRMFWIETQLGITDFLDNNNLPTVLPQFEGRLALDFVPSDSPSGPVSAVFFDGLIVRQVSVPEPSSLLLLGSGLLGFGAVALRRRRG